MAPALNDMTGWNENESMMTQIANEPKNTARPTQKKATFRTFSIDLTCEIQTAAKFTGSQFTIRGAAQVRDALPIIA